MKPDPLFLLPIEPVKLFDDYYYVGNKMVGFHILKTSEGLVLFDAMDLTDADEKFLIPGLKKLGLDGERILCLFLTHGHFDHYLGAEHVRRRTGCDVMLSREDTAYMLWCHENRGGNKEQLVPRITKYVEIGDEISLGDHTVTVLDGAGHTPGCLNYSFEVHDRGETHRVIMMGGYGIFGPGYYPEEDYPYGTAYAVEQALKYAASCVRTWEYCKENHCDIYINPHPNLCDLLEHAAENADRKEGEANAFVIGLENVRTWIEDRYDAAVKLTDEFTDIRKSV